MMNLEKYIECNKDKSIQELIKERDNLNEKIKYHEIECALNNELIHPNYLYCLNWITKTIIKKQTEEMQDIERENTDDIASGILGFVVGDCLGVPVEFKSRSYLKLNPVKDMLEKGTHFQPKGTWSDDTSMVIATMESLVKLEGYNSKSFYDMADRFVDWYKKGLYTPNGETFDIGNTTKEALDKFILKKDKNCGKSSLYDNGNGSLMRIIPLAYYFYKADIGLQQRKKITFQVSSITHSHIISLYACLMYVEFLMNILYGMDKYEAYKYMLETINESLDSEETQNRKMLTEAYKRILNGKINTLKEKDIKSTGYVVDTLEAVLWVVLNSKEYKESVLKAVNLGNDTDTIGALVGGLLGAIYGLNSIPAEWIASVIKKEEILNICELMENTEYKKIEEFITITGQILNYKNISSEYESLYTILSEYRDYHKKTEAGKCPGDTARILCNKLVFNGMSVATYNCIPRVELYELSNSNNKKEDINKLDVLECLALITSIDRQEYYGYEFCHHEYTANGVLPLLVNRILDIIEYKINKDKKIILEYINSEKKYIIYSDQTIVIYNNLKNKVKIETRKLTKEQYEEILKKFKKAKDVFC